MKTKLIELWKTNCEDCEKAMPIVAQLQEEGFVFEKHNIEDQIGQRLWNEYGKEIDENSRKQDYEEGYIYTPTFVNPSTREVLAQLDFKYQEETGEVLFANWCGRTDDQINPGNVAVIGRLSPTSQRLFVGAWGRDIGLRNIFAPLVVVLPQKLAV